MSDEFPHVRSHEPHMDINPTEDLQAQADELEERLIDFAVRIIRLSPAQRHHAAEQRVVQNLHSFTKDGSVW